MHKKPLVAVFVLGLLLIAAGIGWATPVPSKDGAVANHRSAPSITPSPRDLEGGGSVVKIQAGTPLSVQGTFCDGYWQGPTTYYVGNWMQGAESYAVYQDPESVLPYSFGAGCDAPQLVFNVTAINWLLTKRPTCSSYGSINPFTYTMQPIVYDVDSVTNPACRLPGGIYRAGPIYSITLTNLNNPAGCVGGGITYLLNLSFSTEVCVHGPYFAGVYMPVFYGPGHGAHVLFDDGGFYWPGPVPGQLCRTYNDKGAGWVDLNDPAGPWFELNLLLWSEGYTPADPATQCTPGICDWQVWHGKGVHEVDYSDPDLFGYTMPNATGYRQVMTVRFTSDCQDTLKEIAFFGYSYIGTPDVLIEVRAPQAGAMGSCSMPTEPGALLYSVVIPNANLFDDPVPNIVPIPDIVWGSLNGGLPQDLFVTLSIPGGLPTGPRYVVLARTVDYGQCSADPHSMTQISGDWWYLADAYGDHDEVYIEANICKEQCPIVEYNCAVAGPDDWNTWAHDYRRTSASTINLGDPCQVRAQWTEYLPNNNSFTNPVVAGGKVYVSSDAEVSMYELASGGAPTGFLSLFPFTGGLVRCNVSVEGNRVFITGGDAKAISCWDSTLTPNGLGGATFWSDDQFSGPLSYVGNGPLNARNRFGATAVYAIVPGLVDPVDSVVVVGTEGATTTGSGRLYALDVKTGFLYNGWATNPIVLDRGSWHSPAYDGTNLYVGTADGTSAIKNGSLYSIKATDGSPNWTYKDPLAMDEGWPGGVSVEGDIIYASTHLTDATLGNIGHRYAIDKSLAGPGPVLAPAAVKWRFANGPTLYAAPTIGTNFVYIPQDDPSAGVLMVDKAIGKAAYNFAANGVGGVSQNVSMTCDKYLFAGDRSGYWWLLNITDQSTEWRREFGGIVNGTALAHHSVTGDDYAVMSSRTSYMTGTGQVTAWRFNQSDRPFLRQMVYSTEILVPLNSPAFGHTEMGVYGNDGCVDLNITGTNIIEIAPAAKLFSNAQQKYAAAYADRKVGDDYVTYFESGISSKRNRMAGVGATVDGELTVFDQAKDDALKALGSSKRTGRATAAGANTDIQRTVAGSVNYSTNPIPEDGTTNMTWMIDQDGPFDTDPLGRGLDDEIIETVTDDPDFYGDPAVGYPWLVVHYIGGCPEQTTTMTWNANVEKVYNWGSLGGMKGSGDGALKWAADPTGSDQWLFDGGLVLIGDSSSAVGGAEVRIGIYSNNARNYVADPRPSDGTCGFDGATGVLMGYKRTGGCPGVPAEIHGVWVRGAFSDTGEFYPPTSPLSALGLSMVQTEVGADDPMYGDFKLIQWKLHNRDNVAKNNWYAGTFVDWDVEAGTDNTGAYRDDYNGYFVRETTAPFRPFAYGMFVPEMPTAYCGVNPVPNAPKRIEVVSNTLRVYATSSPPGEWTMTPPTGHARVWNSIVNQLPTRGVDNGALAEDKSGLLINKALNFDPNGDQEIHQALYAVDASSGDNTLTGDNGAGVAKKAARWAGFARGDVNDDGCCNLADVCWLNSGNQIYPDTYCGDVDLVGGEGDPADAAYLLAYVSGTGPAPLGKWRFTF